MFRRFAAGLLAGMAITAAPARAYAGPATTTVQELHAGMQRAAAEARTVSLEQRRSRFEQIVRTTMSVEAIARARMGAAWNTLSADQRRQLVEALAGAIAADYVEEAAGGAFTFSEPSEKPGAGSSLLVTTEIARGRSRQARQYVVEQVQGRHVIVNRLVAGRDENALEAAKYARAMQEGGFEAVIELLEDDDGGVAPAGETAMQLVARLQNELLGMMQQAKQLGYAGRYRKLDGLIRGTHYIPAIARLTLGRHWGALNRDQQRQLVKTFGDLSVANYASKFDGYSGERFSQVEERQVGKSTIVRTVLTKSNGKKHTLDYTLRKVKGRWRILNITADGVSDLATKKAEYGSVMGTSGFAGLIAKLQEQIRRYEAGS